MHKSQIIIAIFLLCALFSIWDIWGPPNATLFEEEYIAAPAHLDLAPDARFLDLENRSRALYDFKGKNIIVNFWATWCTPCIIEIPDLIKLASDHKEDVVFIALSVDQNAEDVIDFIKHISDENELSPDHENIIFGMDTDKSISENLFGTFKYPETYIIGRDMLIKKRIQGLTDWHSEEIKALITEEN